jgi:hypothetical protein
MRNIVVAAIIAAGFVCSPVMLLTSTSALAVDCSDPNDPGNRPGGYCKLIAPGGSLSTPVGAGVDCSFYVSDVSDLIPREFGTSVLVACAYVPEVCRNEA